MKLLFVTQVMDREDTVLGAYHAWVAELASRVESIIVVCLQEGAHALPPNVQVYSLGKEKGAQGRIRYARLFLGLVWDLRDRYDTVFVHMNQEYILIAGWLWKLLGKRIYMWRNHYAGSWLTDAAAAFCTKVFCTSKHSYTARYKKTVYMPVGISLHTFHADTNVTRVPHSILFLARIAPSKKPEMLLEALEILASKDISFTASFYGDPLPADRAFYDALVARAQAPELGGRVTFHIGIPNEQTPKIYSAHDIFVNCSRSGMFDKTIFEAAACGCAVLASSKDWQQIAGESNGFEDASTLAARLENIIRSNAENRIELAHKEMDLASQHGLTALMDRIVVEVAA